MQKSLHLVFGVFGNATGLFLFLSPMITFKRILMNRSTEKFCVIPYVMTLLNCLLAAWYGLPFISQNNIPLTVINCIGVAVETIYVLIFLAFSSRTEKAKVLGLLLSVIIIFSTIACVSFLVLHEMKTRTLLCGSASTVVAIIMYASPLSVMRMVMRTKSVEYMPFFLSTFVFLCGTCWFIYGLIGKDTFLIVPNGFGCALGAMQLILYAFYRVNKVDAEKPAIHDSLEMGFGKPCQEKNSNIHSEDP